MQLMNQSTTGERITAALSTIVAVALLGAAVTAEHAGQPGQGRLERLESDLRFQLDMAYRLDAAAGREQVAALEATLDAWRLGRKSERDDRVLAGWLRESILRSMPSEVRALPATPSFGQTSGQATGDRRQEATRATALPRVDATVKDAVAVKTETPTRASKPAESTPPKIIVAITSPVDIRESDAAAREVQAANAATKSQSAGIANDAVMAHNPTPEVTEPIANDDVPPVEVNEPTHVAKLVAAPTIAESTKAYQIDPTAAPRAIEHSVTKVVVEKPRTEPEAKVEVNLAELNARIRGYHAGLDEVEGAISGGRDGLTEEEAAKLVGEVEQLAVQYQFVRLYYDTLTKNERRRATAPRELHGTIKLIERQISQLEQSRDESDFLASAASDVGKQSLARRLQAAAEAAGE